MAPPPRVARALPSSPPTSPSPSDVDEGQMLTLGEYSSDSVPTSAAITANEEPYSPPPPAPPPPPQPPLTPPPTIKGGVRLVRRQSTSSAPQVDGKIQGHVRSATDPSSSTPDLRSTNANGGSKAVTPSNPADEFASALKRSNTINSFTPSSLKKSRARAGYRNWNGNGSPSERVDQVPSSNINGTGSGSRNGNGSGKSTTPNPNPNSTDAKEKEKERRASSPPPVKPKPDTLSLSKKTKRGGRHERSGSSSHIDLLKTAIVKGASSRAAAVNGKPPSTPGTPGTPGSDSKNLRETKKLSDVEVPERRNSVQSIARSLESTLTFSALPSPGTPPSWRNRSSVASSKSLMSVNSLSRRDGDGGSPERGEDVQREDGREEAGDEKAEERERISTVLPAEYQAVIAAIAKKAQLSKRTEREPPASSAKPARTPSPPASPSKPASSPATAPTPPRSPPPDFKGSIAAAALAKAKASKSSSKEASSSSTDIPDSSDATTSSMHASASPPPTPPRSPPVPTKPKPQMKTVSVPSTPPSPPRTEEAPSSPPAISSPPSSPKEDETEKKAVISFTRESSSIVEDKSDPSESEKPEEEATQVVPAAAPSKAASTRYSVPPSRPPPPLPVEAETEAEAEADLTVTGERKVNKNEEGEGMPTLSTPAQETSADPQDQTNVPTPGPTSPPSSTAKPVKRYSIPLPPRPPPPPPAEDSDTDEEMRVPTPIVEEPEEEEAEAVAQEDGAQGDKEEEEEEEEYRKNILGGVVVQEPEEMNDMGEIADEKDVQEVEVVQVQYDSGDYSSTDEDERYDSYRTARSRNGSSSLPPTPPTKHGGSFPIQLTSKWSRNTSAMQSANASASTLALQEQLQAHIQLHSEVEAAEAESDNESQVDEGTTLAHANLNDLNDLNDLKDSNDSITTTKNVVEEDPMDSRFKFPPVESFPPPPPLPFKRTTNNANRNMRVFGVPNESETSLASIHEDESGADDADRDTIVESNVRRFRKKSKAKSKLTSAIAAALAKTPPPPLGGEPEGVQASTRSETESTTSRSSSEETNPLARQMRARYAEIDAQELPRPTPFPTVGDGSAGQSQSLPEIPTARRPGTGAGDDRRTVRLSSKLLPITGPQRMNTSPSTITAWGKHKAVSSETLGTIGTIATEPGDLDTSQFGGLALSGAAASAHIHANGPPSSFLHRMKSDASRRPPTARRQTTTSQASRFVEGLPASLPFLKRSTSPNPTSNASTHQRSVTISFSSRARTGSLGQGPPTRKNSIIPELRAATIEAAERPLSAVSGDFVLIEEPEEFDIPRAEWDLPRIPSGSLRMPSSMDLKTKFKQFDQANGVGKEGRGRGPSSAPATTAPSVPMAVMMQHSRSETMGTVGTTDSNGSENTAKTSTSAPAAPGPISFQPSTGGDSTLTVGRLSSDALLDLWGRVGVYMSDAAALLHDKSRRVLVGDGTYPGFVLAVARQVPTACIPSHSARYPYGHLIYFQTAATVHKRYAEIMPGDVIVLQNALFKGVRGPLHQSYQEELGTKGDPVVGVIGEFEARKSKVRVYQANQHVGIQTVEYVSYRFEDLKSGTIKIFRVPDS